METTIEQTSPVEYELKIHATAEDLKPQLEKALRRQGKNMDVKGFRQGKVPLGLVKKMHGDAIGFQVAEDYVQDVFDEEIEQNSDLEPLGRPALTEFDYELDGDLQATITFGVRPEVELSDLSDVDLPVLKHEVSDEDVEREVEALRKDEADMIPVEDEGAEEGDYVVIDLQRIDASTDTPIIGDKDEDLDFHLDEDWVMDELRDAILGQSPGDVFRVELPGDEPIDGDEDEGGEPQLYEVTLKEVKRAELPAFDEAFVDMVTDGRFEDPDAFRDEIRSQIEQAWSQRTEQIMQNEIVDKMLELHPVPVPESIIQMNLDHFREQVKQENDGDLPDDFDEEFFRQQYRDDAEQQGRWMLIRDEVIEQNAIEAGDDELEDFFNEQAGGESGIESEQIKQFYQQMPQMMERVKQRIISQKVYDVLLDRFDTRELSVDEFEQEMKEREERRAALAGGPMAGQGAPSGGAPTPGA